MTKVLIIGAGPAGLGAAEVLAGAQVTVVERQRNRAAFRACAAIRPLACESFTG